MNLGNHLISHWEMFKHLVVGDDESADATRGFYDEYLSVCDMTSEFYLQTVDVVFQRHLLPKGELEHRGRWLTPRRSRIRRAGHRRRARRYFGIGQTKAGSTSRRA
jgi:poly(3-hydroxybutyrate) depolymerase